MKYLITGHTGFKGAWLAMILKSLGHEVVGISLPPLKGSLYETAALSDLFSREFFIDIRDKSEFLAAINSINPEIAFHLAAQPLVRESYKNPIETFETNVIGTLNFLAGIRDCEVKAAIVITTDKVYKNKNLLRGYVESDELGGHDPYSSSKASADIAAQSWSTSFECTNIAIARAGNVIGGGDWAIDRLIPDLVKSFTKKEPARIRYPNAIRPWQHVADCLNGYLLLSDAMVSSKVTGEWNFGPEIDLNTTVSKVADVAVATWGKGASWDVDDELQPHEADHLLLDSTKSRDLLGWKDKYSFQDSVERSIKYYMQTQSGISPRTLLEQEVVEFLSLS